MEFGIEKGLGLRVQGDVGSKWNGQRNGGIYGFRGLGSVTGCIS